jgi:hypothetical protein
MLADRRCCASSTRPLSRTAELTLPACHRRSIRFGMHGRTFDSRVGAQPAEPVRTGTRTTGDRSDRPRTAFDESIDRAMRCCLVGAAGHDSDRAVFRRRSGERRAGTISATPGRSTATPGGNRSKSRVSRSGPRESEISASRAPARRRAGSTRSHARCSPRRAGWGRSVAACPRHRWRCPPSAVRPAPRARLHRTVRNRQLVGLDVAELVSALRRPREGMIVGLAQELG